LSRELKGKRIVIYPQYLDSTKTRSEGRRVPLNIAVSNPLIEEIYAVAEALGLNPEVEENKHYPKSWWEQPGRVIVDKIGSKLNTLKLIASKISELRKHHGMTTR